RRPGKPCGKRRFVGEKPEGSDLLHPNRLNDFAAPGTMMDFRQAENWLPPALRDFREQVDFAGCRPGMALHAEAHEHVPVTAHPLAAKLYGTTLAIHKVSIVVRTATRTIRDTHGIPLSSGLGSDELEALDVRRLDGFRLHGGRSNGRDDCRRHFRLSG